VAPLAGRTLRVMIAEGQHAELLNAAVAAADRYLADHHDELSDRFEVEAPRWVPDAVYRRIFDRLYTRLRQRLVAIAADPDDETRRQLEAWIAALPDRLETDPELRRADLQPAGTPPGPRSAVHPHQRHRSRRRRRPGPARHRPGAGLIGSAAGQQQHRTAASAAASASRTLRSRRSA